METLFLTSGVVTLCESFLLPVWSVSVAFKWKLWSAVSLWEFVKQIHKANMSPISSVNHRCLLVLCSVCRLMRCCADYVFFPICDRCELKPFVHCDNIQCFNKHDLYTLCSYFPWTTTKIISKSYCWFFKFGRFPTRFLSSVWHVRVQRQPVFGALNVLLLSGFFIAANVCNITWAAFFLVLEAFFRALCKTAHEMPMLLCYISHLFWLWNTEFQFKII